jgi:hypothetical protein
MVIFISSVGTGDIVGIGVGSLFVSSAIAVINMQLIDKTNAVITAVILFFTAITPFL